VETVEVEFDMIHVVPPQTAPDFVRVSPLADAAGWVDVDQATLRHKTWENIWSLGDVMNAPNAKTAAAARMQAPVVAANVVADMRGRAPVAQYNGYGSCPLTVERGKIVLAEFADPRLGRELHRETATSDLVAAVIVTIMLIPQSLAYAMLAGLPPEMGLYASILPLVAYAIFGTSRALAVGPVAVVSLMTAAAVGNLALQGTAEYAAAAIVLAFLSGLMLLLMGVFRLGFLANFLSHPVIAGFITASGILIAASQLRHILGIPGGGHTLIEIAESLWANLGATNPITLASSARRGLPVLGAQGG
jgi:hypothetical protein